MKTRILNERIVLLILAAGLVTFFGIQSKGLLFASSTLSTFGFQLPEFGILTLGMMLCILTGGINLSLITTSALSGILGALILSSEAIADTSVRIAVALFVCLISAVAMGVLNGAIISYLNVPAIIATLGTSTLFEGICLNLTRGGSVAGYPKEFFVIGTGDIFGIPIPLIIFAAVAVVFSLILQRTSWGEKIYMVGSNPTASMYAGINNRAMLFGTYILSGLLSGTAGIIIISRYNSAKADHGVSYLLQTVAASVLGGVSISGGFGKVSGVVIAVAIIQLVTTGFNILGISKLYTDIVVGLILIGVLAFGRFRVLYSEKRNKVVTG